MGDQDRGASAAKRAALFRPSGSDAELIVGMQMVKGGGGSGSGVMQLTVAAVAKGADPSTKG